MPLFVLFFFLASLLSSAAFAQAPGRAEIGIDRSGSGRALQVYDPVLGGYVPMGVLDTTTHTFSGSFKQSGTGALARTSQDKLREVVSVSDFCANASPGTTDNATCINAAVTAAAARPTGAVVKFPCGNWRVNSAITIAASNVSIMGDGRCSVITGVGNFNTISVSGVAGADVYGNEVRDLYMPEYAKTGGNAISATYTALFRIRRVIIDSPYNGLRLNNFNDIEIHDTRVYGPRGSYCTMLTGGAGTAAPTNRSDFAKIENTVCTGLGASGGADAFVIDGFVNTVLGSTAVGISTDNSCLVVRNDVGGAQPPQFISFRNFECDGPYGPGVYLYKGTRAEFTDPHLHGSKSSHNMLIGSDWQYLSVVGGFFSGARAAGLDVAGQNITISGVNVMNNSNPSLGATSGQYAAITLESTARRVTIKGSNLGSAETNWMGYGVFINSGADQYAITGNTMFGNVNPGIGGQTTARLSRVVSPNGQ